MAAGLVERLAALVEGLAETDGGVLHALVGLGAAADEQEVLAARDALLPVRVEAHTQEARDAPFAVFRRA